MIAAKSSKHANDHYHGTVELIYNRMMVEEAGPSTALSIFFSHIMSFPPRDLDLDLEFKFVNEEGFGDGPMREFFGSMYPLFRILR